MSRIIAGHFQLQEQIDVARVALNQAGFSDSRISAFFVNQPGQHDLHALGGDRDMSPGAKETPEGVVEGVAVGAAVGAGIGAVTTLATGPLGPVVGALVGAHVGSLYSFNKMKDAGEAEKNGESNGENRRQPRHPGMLIAVALGGLDERERALEALHRLGAEHIEEAEGTIANGDWHDFDPLSIPVLVA
ncbi:membrane protein [Janthinobacterium lividum]|uniref:glycine zipper domain-containing protein n=1 Tax=Janthinobacterium lividum TaxID=29581 RepID=UPI000537A669|nr:glycine zipper domain-containing protein [Janthinobacterium lividum]KHA76552.1 membrane protein [Janthinobacterium lividum]